MGAALEHMLIGELASPESAGSRAPRSLAKR